MMKTNPLALLPLLVAIHLVTAGCGDTDEIPCETTLDCQESLEFSSRLGRCVSEAYCLHGSCGGSCVEPCEMGDPAVNPCDDPGSICTEPVAPNAMVSFCTALPIACESDEGCPVFKPTETGAWACIEGICRFPNFAYAINPSG